MMKIPVKLGKWSFRSYTALLLVLLDFIVGYTEISFIGVRNILFNMNTLNLNTLNLSKLLSIKVTILTLGIAESKF